MVDLGDSTIVRAFRTRLGLLVVALAVGGLLAAACSGDASPSDSDGVALADRARPDEHQLIESPTTDGGFKAILGTDDLSPGRHRLGFVLISTTLGVVSEPTVSVTLYTGDSGGAALGTYEATYQPWPLGSRGLYTAKVEFPSAGPHRIEIAAPLEGGGTEPVVLAFDVPAATSAPGVGAEAVPSVTKTLADTSDPTELTTGSLYDPDLYQVTLADAIATDSPVVVVFASPAFCINAVCGPQVEVLSELQEAYGDRASFVHVDLYENPQTIQGDLSQAVIAQAVWDWNLPSNEWTFVIDGQGRVAARFEAFATFSEIEEELKKLLS